MSFGAIIADTPGFSSFDTEMMDKIPAPEMKRMFREFEPYNDNCRFADCAHVKEAGCCVLEAVKSGGICKSRHDSYVRLYETAKARKDWE